MSNILVLFIMRIAFIFQNFSYLKTGSKCFLVGNLINELWSLHIIDCLALCHVKEADLKRLHTIWDTRKNKNKNKKCERQIELPQNMITFSCLSDAFMIPYPSVCWKSLFCEANEIHDQLHHLLSPGWPNV